MSTTTASLLANVSTPLLAAWVNGEKFPNWEALGLPSEFSDSCWLGESLGLDAEVELRTREDFVEALAPLLVAPIEDRFGRHHPWPEFVQVVAARTRSRAAFNRELALATIRARVEKSPTDHQDWRDRMWLLAHLFVAMASTPRTTSDDGLNWKSDPFFALVGEVLPAHPRPKPHFAEPFSIDSLVWLIFETVFDRHAHDHYRGDNDSSTLTGEERIRYFMHTWSYNNGVRSEEFRPVIENLHALGWPLCHAVWCTETVADERVHNSHMIVRRDPKTGLPLLEDERLMIGKLAIFLNSLAHQVRGARWAENVEQFNGIVHALEELLPCIVAVREGGERDFLRPEIAAQDAITAFGTAGVALLLGEMGSHDDRRVVCLSLIGQIGRNIIHHARSSSERPIQSLEVLVRWLLRLISVRQDGDPFRAIHGALEALRYLQIPSGLRADVRSVLVPKLNPPELGEARIKENPDILLLWERVALNAALGLTRLDLAGAVSSGEYSEANAVLSRLSGQARHLAEIQATLMHEREFLVRHW